MRLHLSLVLFLLILSPCQVRCESLLFQPPVTRTVPSGSPGSSPNDAVRSTGTVFRQESVFIPTQPLVLRQLSYVDVSFSSVQRQIVPGTEDIAVADERPALPLTESPLPALLSVAPAGGAADVSATDPQAADLFGTLLWSGLSTRPMQHESRLSLGDEVLSALVPEPSSAALLIGLTCLLAAFQRSRLMHRKRVFS